MYLLRGEHSSGSLEPPSPSLTSFEKELLLLPRTRPPRERERESSRKGIVPTRRLLVGNWRESLVIPAHEGKTTDRKINFMEIVRDGLVSGRVLHGGKKMLGGFRWLGGMEA